MNIIVNGACGRMGKEVLASIDAGYRGASLSAAVDKFSDSADIYSSLSDYTGNADCIIDFSNHVLTREVCDYAVSRKIPTVIATTGQTQEELAVIKASSAKVPIFLSANMSLGVAVLCDLTRRAVEAFPEADIEIVEAHHNRKLDAPSGTALLLAESAREARPDSRLVYGRSGHEKRDPAEIGVHALRMGNVVGEHTVYIATDSQIITLAHSAQTRAVFAEGAVVAAEYLIGRSAGIYTMQDVLRG